MPALTERQLGSSATQTEIADIVARRAWCPNGRPWTVEEEAVLRQHYGRVTQSELVRLLPGRTGPAIAGRLAKLGIRSPKEPPWSDQEIALLKGQFQVLKLSAIAKQLGRSFMAVKVKAKRLGLRRCDRMEFTPRQIGRILNLCSKEVKRWMSKGLLAARRAPAEQLRMHLVTREDLIEFLRRHPEEWDARRCPDVHIHLGLTRKRGEAARMDRPLWLREKLAEDLVRRRMGQRWTDGEDRQLARYVKQGLTYKQIGQRMGRTAAAIEHRVHRLGRRIWTLVRPELGPLLMTNG